MLAWSITYTGSIYYLVTYHITCSYIPYYLLVHYILPHDALYITS